MLSEGESGSWRLWIFCIWFISEFFLGVEKSLLSICLLGLLVQRFCNKFWWRTWRVLCITVLTSLGQELECLFSINAFLKNKHVFLGVFHSWGSTFWVPTEQTVFGFWRKTSGNGNFMTLFFNICKELAGKVLLLFSCQKIHVVSFYLGQQPSFLCSIGIRLIPVKQFV